jgi:hypothetical protein
MPPKAGLIGAGVALPEALNVGVMDGEGDGVMDAEDDRAMHSLVVEEGIQFGALQTHEPAVSVE